MRGARFTAGLLLVLALVAGAWLWLQRQAAETLRAELALLREQNIELARLRADNEQLKASQLPTQELERLQADHAAVLRLRTEVQRTGESVVEKEKAQGELRAVKLTLSVGIGADGQVLLDGEGFTSEKLRERLAGLARGERIKVNFHSPTGGVETETTSKGVKMVTEELRKLAKELGLKAEIQLRSRDERMN
jgi:hypothetical protein